MSETKLSEEERKKKLEALANSLPGDVVSREEAFPRKRRSARNIAMHRAALEEARAEREAKLVGSQEGKPKFKVTQSPFAPKMTGSAKPAAPKSEAKKPSPGIIEKPTPFSKKPLEDAPDSIASKSDTEDTDSIEKKPASATAAKSVSKEEPANKPVSSIAPSKANKPVLAPKSALQTVSKSQTQQDNTKLPTASQAKKSTATSAGAKPATKPSAKPLPASTGYKAKIAPTAASTTDTQVQKSSPASRPSASEKSQREEQPQASAKEVVVTLPLLIIDAIAACVSITAAVLIFTTA